MTVSVFDQPNSSTQTAAQYKASIENSIKVSGVIGQMYAPHQRTDLGSNPFTMQVQVDAGALFVNGALVANSVQTTGAITAPTTNPRIDRVVIDATTGVISVVTGTEAASPAPPAIPSGKLPCANVGLAVGQTSILNAHITDERTFVPPIPATTKATTKDHGTKSGNYTLQLDEAELHLVTFSAAATLTIASATNDKATVVVKNTGTTITIAGIDNDSPTLSTSNTGTVTITIASPGVVTWTAHGRTANSPVVFTTTGALPTGLVAGTIYYVVGASITTNTFQVSATPGGAAINASGSQSGVHTATSNQQDFLGVVKSFGKISCVAAVLNKAAS